MPLLHTGRARERWRGYLHTFSPPAQAGSRIAAHSDARPSPGLRLGQPRCGMLLHTVCYFRPVTVFPSVTYKAAARGSGRPHCHRVTARSVAVGLCRCGPSRVLVPCIWPDFPLSPFLPGRSR